MSRGLGDVYKRQVKKLLINILEEELAPIRERRKHFEQNIPEVYEILRAGSEKARETAARTLDEVRNAMRINYFADSDLIAEQAARFRAK